ncbi:hypothetical protein PS044_09090 [Escherichia albertii]|uniref:hypothetical protein n=1 Tax=Escherichia albertii TaxID=208962 RepID=UPI00235E7532|nr:hypothetical protein [Escherichia albertii]WDB58339.1 hypothetical protein PS044_09090 [Escherichia albertii]
MSLLNDVQKFIEAHPTYGELKVCVDGEVRVSTSKSEGRIVRFDLKFVEAGELSYPTSGAATAQTLMSSCSALDDCISDSFSGFSIDGVADFVQNDVIGNASIMLGYVSDAMKVVDSAVSDAARLLQGDISVLLPPPSSGKNFVEQVQKMWRTGKRLYGNASDLVTMIKTLSGVSLGSDLQPRGVWKTDSKTTATATQQRNVVASTLRTTAISEAAYAVTPEIRAAITAELRSFLLRDGYPQGELKVSRISEAISGANGEYSHQLLAPADNISIAKNELAVLGTISWT